MGREEESRHKSKRHKRERDKEEDNDLRERDRKKTRGDKVAKELTPPKTDADSRRLGADAAEPARSPRENGRETGQSREDANGEVSMSVEETNRYYTPCSPSDAKLT